MLKRYQIDKIGLGNIPKSFRDRVLKNEITSSQFKNYFELAAKKLKFFFNRGLAFLQLIVLHQKCE